MPRDSNGIYSLPPGYEAVTGEVIQPSQHNPPLEDIASALTGSLPRSGSAPMLGQVKLVDGSASAPGIAFNSALSTGFFKTTNGIGLAVAGVLVAEFGAGGLLGLTPVGTGADFWGRTAPANWLFAYGQAVSSTTYAALFDVFVTTATVTISVASPGEVGWTAHGLTAGDPVKFTTTGTLPTGLTAGTTYYVVGTGLTANTFRVSATPGGAAINMTGTQSGVHTGIYAPYGCANDLSTFNMPDKRGRGSFGKDDMGGTSANRITGLSGGWNGDTLGAAGGAETHTLTTNEIPAVTPTGQANSAGSLSGQTSVIKAFGVQLGSGATGYGIGAGSDVTIGVSIADPARSLTMNQLGGGLAHNNLPPGITCNYIIFAGA